MSKNGSRSKRAERVAGRRDGAPLGTESVPAPAARRRTRRRWLLDVALVVGVYVGISAFQERHLLGRGTEAPKLDLRTPSGERVSLQALRGKRVLLHFWATWCGVCRREHAALNALHEDLDNDEVVLSIVADADDVATVESVVTEEALRYPVLLATEDVIADYRVSAFPTNYYLDAEGRVRSTTVGMSNRWVMAARLAAARW